MDYELCTTSTLRVENQICALYHSIIEVLFSEDIFHSNEGRLFNLLQERIINKLANLIYWNPDSNDFYRLKRVYPTIILPDSSCYNDPLISVSVTKGDKLTFADVENPDLYENQFRDLVNLYPYPELIKYYLHNSEKLIRIFIGVLTTLLNYESLFSVIEPHGKMTLLIGPEVELDPLEGNSLSLNGYSPTPFNCRLERIISRMTNRLVQSQCPFIRKLPTGEYMSLRPVVSFTNYDKDVNKIIDLYDDVEIFQTFTWEISDLRIQVWELKWGDRSMKPFDKDKSHVIETYTFCKTTATVIINAMLKRLPHTWYVRKLIDTMCVIMEDQIPELFFNVSDNSGLNSIDAAFIIPKLVPFKYGSGAGQSHGDDLGGELFLDYIHHVSSPLFESDEFPDMETILQSIQNTEIWKIAGIDIGDIQGINEIYEDYGEEIFGRFCVKVYFGLCLVNFITTMLNLIYDYPSTDQLETDPSELNMLWGIGVESPAKLLWENRIADTIFISTVWHNIMNTDNVSYIILPDGTIDAYYFKSDFLITRDENQVIVQIKNLRIWHDESLHEEGAE